MEIIALNPEIKERGGLKEEGVEIPVQKIETGVVKLIITPIFMRSNLSQDCSFAYPEIW